MISTMRSRGYYVLCYSKEDYEQKKGETKKIGPFKSVGNAFARKQAEEKKWHFVEVVEGVIMTDY